MRQAAADVAKERRRKEVVRAKEGLDQLVARMESRVHAAEADAKAARANAADASPAVMSGDATPVVVAPSAASVAALPAAWVEEKQGLEAALAAATRELDHSKSAWEAEKASMQTLLHREVAARQTELAKERQALWGQVTQKQCPRHALRSTPRRLSAHLLLPFSSTYLSFPTFIFLSRVSFRHYQEEAALADTMHAVLELHQLRSQVA